MSTEDDKKAIEAGKLQAKEALTFRDEALSLRRTVLSRATANLHTTNLTPRPFMYKAEHMDGAPFSFHSMPSLDFFDRATTGVLVAEGDSWFDYPFYDVLRYLEDEYGYDVQSVAHKGDAVEDMAFSGGQLEEFTRRIEKILRGGVIPKAILLSGGGNDIGGAQFAMLLNHKQSRMASLNEDVIRGVVDCRIRNSYIAILSAVTVVCESKIGKKIPILTHGYDYAVPDGRGFLGGFGPLPGPWLEPSFRCKGYDNLKENAEVLKHLIDRLNSMLISVCAMTDFQHVKHVDLRGTLSAELTSQKYKESWGNELHPTKHGFKAVAQKFAEEISHIL